MTTTLGLLKRRGYDEVVLLNDAITADTLGVWDDFGATVAEKLDGALNELIEEAELQVGATPFGEYWQLAVVYLALHMLTMTLGEASGPGGASGPIVGKRAGEVSINWSSSMQYPMGEGDSNLRLTKYGREFLRLRNKRPGIKMVITKGTWVGDVSS